MNNESSRSHAVFTLKLTQTLSTDSSEVKTESSTRISFSDSTREVKKKFFISFRVRHRNAARPKVLVGFARRCDFSHHEARWISASLEENLRTGRDFPKLFSTPIFIWNLFFQTQSVKVSKISLVDLAGSERVSKSGAQIEQTRFREGCNINK